MKQLMVIAAVLAVSSAAFAKDYQKIAETTVVEMYGKPGDQVSTEVVKSNQIRVNLSNGAEHGSASFLVKISDKESANEGQEIGRVKVIYESGN